MTLLPEDFCWCWFMPSLYFSSECSCGWMCFGLNALGSHTCVVQRERSKQDAVQYQQLPQWEYSGEKVLQGVHFVGNFPLLCFVVWLYVLSLSPGIHFKGPPTEGTALCHRGGWILWVAEGGKGEAAFLHLLPSEELSEPGGKRGSAGRQDSILQQGKFGSRGNLSWPFQCVDQFNLVI